MILDQYGNEVTSTRKVIHAASQSRGRAPQFIIQNKTIDELVTDRDRDVVISLSQRLFLNMGAYKCVVNQKSSYSVGNAWLPVYKGSDVEAGEEVKRNLLDDFYKNLDVRGGVWDWWQNLKALSCDMDVKGDHFTILTKDSDGYPKIQTIPPHLVKTKSFQRDGENCVVLDGQYKGRRIHYGIIYDNFKKAIAYRVSTGSAENDFYDVPAASMIHSYNPMMSDEGRGLPIATHALEELKKVLQTTEYESLRFLILSSIGLFVENDSGGPNMLDPRYRMQGNIESSADVNIEYISPHMWYAQAGNGNKITQLDHKAGGDNFESFQDRMIRSFVAGAEWSYSLTWKPTGQGTAERGEILQARKAVSARQAALRRWALKVVFYYYSVMRELGELPELENPTAWDFTTPARLSVDDGREHKMLVESYRLGKTNMEDLLEHDGSQRTYDEHLQARAMESVKRKQVIQKMKEIYGVDISERELVMFTPNETKDVETEFDE